VGRVTGLELYRGPSIYDVHTEGVRVRWTHVDEGREVQFHVDVHT